MHLREEIIQAELDDILNKDYNSFHCLYKGANSIVFRARRRLDNL